MCEKCEAIRAATEEAMAALPAEPMAQTMWRLGDVLGAFASDLARAEGSTVSQREVATAFGEFFRSIIGDMPIVTADDADPTANEQRGEERGMQWLTLMADMTKRSGVPREVIEAPWGVIVENFAEQTSVVVQAAGYAAEMRGVKHDLVTAEYCAYMLSLVDAMVIERAATWTASPTRRRASDALMAALKREHEARAATEAPFAGGLN